MLNNLAQSVADKGDLPRAQELFERVLTLRKAALGLQDAATAQSIDSLALVLQNQAKYADAEALYRQAKQIRENLLGPDAREKNCEEVKGEFRNQYLRRFRHPKPH